MIGMAACYKLPFESLMFNGRPCQYTFQNNQKATRQIKTPRTYAAHVRLQEYWPIQPIHTLYSPLSHRKRNQPPFLPAPYLRRDPRCYVECIRSLCHCLAFRYCTPYTSVSIVHSHLACPPQIVSMRSYHHCFRRYDLKEGKGFAVHGGIRLNKSNQR